MRRAAAAAVAAATAAEAAAPAPQREQQQHNYSVRSTNSSYKPTVSNYQELALMGMDEHEYEEDDWNSDLEESAPQRSTKKTEKARWTDEEVYLSLSSFHSS